MIVYACSPSDTEQHCPGCYAIFDLTQAPPEIQAEGDPKTWADDALDEHTKTCLAYRDHRIAETLRWYAHLDAVRAPGSW